MKKYISLFALITLMVFSFSNDSLAKKESFTASSKAKKSTNKIIIWIGGDSVSTEIGRSIWYQFRRTNKVVVKRFNKGSCGLSRFDYFDWPTELKKEMMLIQPNIVIFLIGANDCQNIMLNNKRGYVFGNEQWRKEYSQRVGQVMDLLGSEDRLLIWLGIPIMRNANFNKKVMALNKIYNDEALKRPFVKYIDTVPLLADSQFQYTDYFPNEKGSLQRIRTSDGIHIYPAGADRISNNLMPMILRQIEVYFTINDIKNVATTLLTTDHHHVLLP
jgi:hypothetical protein